MGEEGEGGCVMFFYFFWGGDGRPWEGRGEEEGSRKGEDPQCLKCVDAHGSGRGETPPVLQQ